MPDLREELLQDQDEAAAIAAVKECLNERELQLQPLLRYLHDGHDPGVLVTWIERHPIYGLDLMTDVVVSWKDLHARLAAAEVHGIPTSDEEWNRVYKEMKEFQEKRRNQTEARSS